METRNQLAVVAVMTAAMAAWLGAATPTVSLPNPAVDDQLATASSKVNAIVAGGCFWGIEELYQHVRGVTDAVSGYSGGAAKNAKYDLGVHRYDRTRGVGAGHLRSLENHVRPVVEDLLFGCARSDAAGWAGTRPRPHTGRFLLLRRSATEDRAGLRRSAHRGAGVQAEHHHADRASDRIYEAESYHQDYAIHNPNQPYIVINDLPKVNALRLQFPQV